MSSTNGKSLRLASTRNRSGQISRVTFSGFVPHVEMPTLNESSPKSLQHANPLGSVRSATTLVSMVEVNKTHPSTSLIYTLYAMEIT
jgi:hypothetical protein